MSELFIPTGIWYILTYLLQAIQEYHVTQNLNCNVLIKFGVRTPIVKFKNGNIFYVCLMVFQNFNLNKDIYF